MSDFQKLSDELTMAFMNYQENLEVAMLPKQRKTEDEMVARYNTDMMFRRRVQALTCGVMQIVQEHCNPKRSGESFNPNNEKS